MGLFSSNKDDIRAKIARKRGDVERIRIDIQQARANKRKDSVAQLQNKLKNIQSDIADLRVKLTKAKK
jgi:hypothetical protein